MHRTSTSIASCLCLSLAFTACGSDDDATSPGGEVGRDQAKSSLSRDTSPQVPSEDLEQLVSGNHALALELFQELGSEPENLLISPLSVRMAFGLLQAGARGNTEAEIDAVLHYDLDQDALHPAFNALDLALADRNDPGNDEEDPIELHLANAFWGKVGYGWKADYLDTLALNYGAGVELLDYAADPEACREVINTWVEERTRDRIQDLLPQGSIRPSTAAVLTNALYFKAPWANVFEAYATAPGDFTKADGSTVTVDYMNNTESFGYTEGTNYEALEMPYRKGELSMVAILPRDMDIGTFETGLDAASLGAILDGLSPSYGRVRFPKFEFETGFSLKQALESMGMTTAFGSADLSGMIDNGGLFISDVFHKTFIAVDEKGTEAAAATAIVIGETSVPVENFSFEATRPFLLLIRDRITGAILFFGRVGDPSA